MAKIQDHWHTKVHLQSEEVMNPIRVCTEEKSFEYMLKHGVFLHFHSCIEDTSISLNPEYCSNLGTSKLKETS